MWLSGGLGVTLALLYGAASFLTNKKALKVDSQQQFITLVLGGLALRFFGVLALFAGLMLLVVPENNVFAVSFLSMFVLILLVEVVQYYRMMQTKTTA